MHSFDGSTPTRGASKSPGRSRTSAATGYPQVQTFKDAFVSKASDGASVVVQAGSDVAQSYMWAFTSAKDAAKQGVGVAKEHLDTASEVAKQSPDAVSNVAKQGAALAKERIDAANDVAKQGAAIAKERLDMANAVAKQGSVLAKERLDAANDVAKQGAALARQGVHSAKERLDAVRRGSWSLTARGSCETDETHGESVQQLVDMGFDRAAAARAIAQVGENDSAAAVAILCQQLDTTPKTETPARYAASKLILNEQERVKSTLKRAHASTLNVKRRAGIFFQSKFSQNGAKDGSHVKDPLLEKAETLERQADYSETSDSETSDSETSDSQTSDSETFEEASDSEAFDSGRATQLDSTMVDSVEAIPEPWSLRPSTGTWLLQKPCPTKSKNHPVEVTGLDCTSDLESLRLRARADLFKKIFAEEEVAEPVPNIESLRLRAQAALFKKAFAEKEVAERATAEDQSQIGKADATPAKLRSSEQTCVSKVMPVRGGA